jgi:hypothetical protein
MSTDIAADIIARCPEHGHSTDTWPECRCAAARKAAAWLAENPDPAEDEQREQDEKQIALAHAAGEHAMCAPVCQAAAEAQLVAQRATDEAAAALAPLATAVRAARARHDAEMRAAGRRDGLLEGAATRNPLVRTDRLLSEILAERVRQDDDHDGAPPTYPDVDTRDIDIVTHGYYRQMAERWQAVNDERAQLNHKQGRCQITEPHPHTAWDGLLIEASYAALSEAHPIRRRARLVELATQAVAWTEDVDRRIAAAAAAYVPPVHYVRSDGKDCCVHAVPVGPGSCPDCWDLAKWDVLGGDAEAAGGDQ